MARYRRRRYYRRSKGKWSTRITNINDQQTVSQEAEVFFSRAIATNPAQSDNTVSQRYTVKNVWMQFTLEQYTSASSVTTNYLQNMQVFIVYIPQGFTVTSSTVYEHPEWVMAQKFVGVPLTGDNPGYSPISVRTRLARKLDTGDKIVFIVQGSNPRGTTTVNISGIVRFNTKAN